MTIPVILVFLLLSSSAAKPVELSEKMPPLGNPYLLPKADVDIFTTLQREHSTARATFAGQSFTGRWKVLVILIDFPDYSWSQTGDQNFDNADSLYTPDHFEKMLFSLGNYKDASSLSGYTGSMRDFYLENSYGQFDIEGIVTKWCTASQNLPYYAAGASGFGQYPNASGRLVEEALALADPEIDFAEFDNDKDGEVDGIFVVHAGPGAEEIYTLDFASHKNYLWSHRGSINTVRYDNVRISNYTLEPENGTIGVFCHEFGHELGLPDLYDTDNSSEGIGEWGLMGGGGWCYREGDQAGSSPAHFSAWSKIQLGWMQATNITADVTDLEIPPVELQPVAFRLWREGRTEREYFLVENRQQIGFDRGLTRRQKDFHLDDPSGLIIYHVDEFGNQANDFRRLIDVEEASPFPLQSGTFEQLDAMRDLSSYVMLSSGNRGDNGDPFPGFTAFSLDEQDFDGPRGADRFDAFSTPASNSNDGDATGVAITGIVLDGQKVFASVTVGLTTGVGAELPDIPRVFGLQRNYPNPFNPETTISFSVPAIEAFTLTILNIRGETVRVFTGNGSGDHQTIVWNGRDQQGWQVSSGVYLCRLSSGDLSFVHKMMLVR